MLLNIHRRRNLLKDSLFIRRKGNLWSNARLESCEIIGSKPRPLSISLYKELVTNSMAYQRDNYGKKSRSFPLLVEFEGSSYSDVGVVLIHLFKNLDDKIAENLLIII